MITLTRLSGSEFCLNPDLIERADATPDTVITLLDGKKYVVAEPLSAVVDAVRRHRAEIIALSAVLAVDVHEDRPHPDIEERLASVATLPLTTTHFLEEQ